MPSRVGFAMVVWVSAAACGTAQTCLIDRLSARQSAGVDRAIKQEMAKQGVVGLAIGILQDGEIVYLKGFGYENWEKKQAVTDKTMFRWASCSKPIAALAAMQLVEAGKLDLDADVRTYVPEFPDKAAPVTTRHLLSHQAGIVHYTNGELIRTKRTYSQPNPYQDVILALDTFKESPLLCQPGQKFLYTTHGYILLSAVVQRAGKLAFAKQVEERIAKPAKMTTLQPDYHWKPLSHRAVGYCKVRGKIVPSTDSDVSWKLGGGGYISTIGDFAEFARGLLTHRFVTEKTEQLMWTRQKLANGKETRYGLGFEIDGSGDRLRVAHSGSQEKAKSRLEIYPRQKHGVVVMSNTEWIRPNEWTTLVYRALGR